MSSRESRSAELYVHGRAEEKVLDAGQAAVVLLTGPPGYGKTTLVQRLRRLWEDAEAPVRQVRLTEDSGLEGIESVLADHERDDDRAWLVVDGAEHIRWEESRDRLVLIRLVARGRLLLVARSEPTIPLHELRLRSELVDVHYRDFEFDLAMTRELASKLGLDVSQRALQRLTDETEGWAAGVSLGLRFAAQQPNPERFLQRFRFVDEPFAGLMERCVFQDLPDDLAAVVMRTAPCGRLNEDIAAAAGAFDPASTLAALRRFNPFLRPEGARPCRFGYAPFFAEYAEHRAKGLGLLDVEWYDRMLRYLADADEYAATELTIRHGEPDRAAALLREHGPGMIFEHGMCTPYLRLYALLPHDERARHALLAALYRIASRLLRLPESERLVAGADGAPVSDADRRALERYREMGEILARYNTQGSEADPRSARTWLERYPEAPVNERALVGILAAAMYRWRLEFAKSAQQLRATESALAHSQARPARAFLMVNRLFLAEWYGNGRSVVEAFKAEFAEYSSSAVRRHTRLPRLWMKAVVMRKIVNAYRLPLAFLQCDWGEYDTAEALIEEHEITLTTDETPYPAGVYIAGARVRAQRGDLPGSLEWLDHGLRVYRGECERVVLALSVYRIATLLRFGRKDLAREFAAEAGLLDASLGWCTNRSRANLFNIGFCRLQCAVVAGHPDSESQLVRFIERAERLCWYRRNIQLRTLRAQWLQHQGREEEARNELETALEIAARREMPAVPWEMDFGSLSALDPRPAAVNVLAERRASVGGPEMEPVYLTHRELEVLQLVDEGLSNKQIGRRLYLTEQTIKWHLHRIYQKLGVRRRTAAVHEAREAGLL